MNTEKKKLHEFLSFLSEATTLPRTRNVDPNRANSKVLNKI